MLEFAEGYDAFIDVTSMRKPPLKASIKDGVEIFEEYERIRRHELLGSLLMTHLATMPREYPTINPKTGLMPDTSASDSLLSPDGYVAFNGFLPTYDIDLCTGKDD